MAGISASGFGDLHAALRFFEQAGERQPSDLLHSHPALANAVKEGKSTPDGFMRSARKGRQAPPMLIVLLVMIEQVVIGTGPSFVRLYGWYRLVRHWCCFRFDDTMGIHPSLLRPHARGLSGILDRTKTSGAGKTFQKLPFFISYQSWIAEPTWLAVGLELLRTEYGFARAKDNPL